MLSPHPGLCRQILILSLADLCPTVLHSIVQPWTQPVTPLGQNSFVSGGHLLCSCLGVLPAHILL